MPNNGGSEIYRVANEQGATPVLFASYPERLEDLECDDVTFAGEGKAAIWSKDAYDAVINAFELNSGDCGYGGVAPAFVVVALGDSYQSGEGVGNSISDTTAYLTTAYENASNYPAQVGPQEDTYTDPFGGNGCHRALANYAKVNRDLYEPGAPVTLVDETCSGAKIEPGIKPPIIGTEGGGVDAESQVAQVLDRLALEGISPDDVDLVTVGMGGNDAGFGSIVQACLAPNLVRKVLEEYPDAPSEIEFLARTLLTCAVLDESGPSIDALQPLEEWGQEQLLATFPNARILQLNYPNPLPSIEGVPEWCGGIRRGDIQYAREKVAAIDSAIAGSVSSTSDDRLELVDVQEALGRNPLCPQDGSQELVNAFDEANVEAEIQRLLNLTPGGDPIARQRFDTLADEYEEYRTCLLNELNPFDGEDCDPGSEWSDVEAAYANLRDYLLGQMPTILANLIEPPGPGAEPLDVRTDRAGGLFHPNMAGFEILACNVRAGYAGQSPSGCQSDPDIVFDTVNGEEAGLAPIDVIIDEMVDFIFGGFESNSPVHITFYSEEIDLGTVTADTNGLIETSIEMPDVNPGVHRIQFSGTGAGGVEVVKEIKVNVPGDPVPGEPYGVYLCCFTGGIAVDGVIEFVDVTYGGTTFTVIPDTEGGIFLELPVPDVSVDLTIDAVSQLNGQQVTQELTVGDPQQSLSYSYDFSGSNEVPWESGWTHFSSDPSEPSPYLDNNLGVLDGSEHGAVSLRPETVSDAVQQLKAIFYDPDEDGQIWGLAMRSDGSGYWSDSGYYCILDYYDNDEDALLYMVRVTNGVRVWLDDPVEIALSGDVWLKCEAQGSDLRAKVWETGSTEPSGWDVEVSDSTYATGRMGTLMDADRQVEIGIDDYSLEGYASSPVSPPDPGGGDWYTDTFTGDYQDPWDSGWTHLPSEAWLPDPYLDGGSGLFDADDDEGEVTSLRPSTYTDSEQLIRVVWYPVENRHWGLTVRHDGEDTGDQSGYYCTLTFNEDINDGEPTLSILRYDNGSLTVLDEVEVTVNTNQWLKCVAEGTSIKARLWDTSAVEPPGWDLEATDSSYSSGQSGVFLYADDDTVRLDDYRLGSASS